MTSAIGSATARRFFTPTKRKRRRRWQKCRISKAKPGLRHGMTSAPAGKKKQPQREKHNNGQAKDAFLKSYGYYGIARHPFPSTPGKAPRICQNSRDVFRRVEVFRRSGRTRSDSLAEQSHRRPFAIAAETARPNDHALGWHRQLEGRTPFFRRKLRQRRLGLLDHR